MICFLFLGYIGWAQSQYTYYLVEEAGTSLEPQSRINNPDGTLNLSFSDPTLNYFFQNNVVFQHEKAFPNAVSTYLQRVYIVKLSNSGYVSSLLNLNNVEHVELVNKGVSLLEPNDPLYVSNSAKSYLTLIRANKAWNITTGSSAIIVGIADTNCETNHEDLAGQVIFHENDPGDSYYHGTFVAGAVSAKTNNGIGIASVGYNTKLAVTERTGVSALWDLAQIPGVRVLNASWHNGTCTYSPIEAEIINEIYEQKGILIIAAAGNGNTCNGPNTYVYPASYENVISVSSIGHTFPIGTTYTWEGQNYQGEWQDVHQVSIDLENPEDHTHQHNDKVDLVAPGYRVMSTNDVNSTGIDCENDYCLGWGTSLASPIVAGAAALIWSVKPSLTANQVENILKSTADDIFWIPYNQPYIGKLGSGRLNVFRAVKTTQCMDVLNPKLNLVVRDTNEDVGNHPNNQSTVFNKSEDMWVRNQNDGRYNETHQNVEYSATNPNYVYVRVTNYGCKTSSGNDELRLYWGIAGTSQPWPSHWDASTLTGGPIGIKSIPALAPGQEVVIEFEWFSPDPDNYPGAISLSGNFSLLSRIISTEDPITFTNGSNINNYVKNNSNVAWKNVHVVDIISSPNPSMPLYVSNPSQEVQTYSIELIENKNQEEKPLYEEAEISIKLDATMLSAWDENENSDSQIESTHLENVKLINGNAPIFSNITLEPGEFGQIELNFNFLTKELTDKENYEYDVIQRNAANGEIVGTATIIINKENREAFLANAQKIENTNSTTLIAENIGEPAIYNWYDSDGDLIYTGTELVLSPEITKTYKLEIISDLDGFKDYKNVEVTGYSPFSLNSLVPNPANSQVTISYEISSASSAYLIVTNVANNNTNNYILDINTSQTILNLSSYPQGVYTISLVCNGIIVNTKNLIKN